MEAPAPHDFSLVHGGPFHGLLERAGLVEHKGRDLFRVAVLLAVLGWVPLVILSMVRHLWLGEHPVYLGTPSVHVRFLVVLPLMVAALKALDARCEVAVRSFTQAGFTDVAGVVRVLTGVERLRDSIWPEFLFLAIAVFIGQEVFWGKLGPSGLAAGTTTGAMAAFTSARGWYGLVALPLFVFYGLRVLWLWVLWSLLLLRLSRLPLKPIPLHPDLSGGLAPLSQPILAFLIIAAAVSCLVSSTFYDQVLHSHARADSFIPDIFVLVGLALLVGLGPLMCFTPVLTAARLDGLNRYGAFGVVYTRAFVRKWIIDPPSESPLGTSDIQSLADLGNSFGVVQRMRIAPFGVPHIIAIVLAVVLPMAPLALTEVPLQVLLRQLGSTLVGSVVP